MSGRNPGEARGVRVSALSLNLDGSPILSDVSFDVEPGSLVSVIGRNGAGKSSLFKWVLSIIKNYVGGISIGGALSASLSAGDRARLVSYVPQNPPDHIPYTVAEFLELSRYPWKTLSNDADDGRAVAEAMSLTGTSALAGRRLDNLSGGERQKVMIAAAIAQETGVILMDEPTTYLDYAHQVEIMEVLARVNRERGVTLIVVTHDVNLALGLSGSVVVMRDGRVNWIGPTDRLLESDRLEEIYGVRFTQYSSRCPLHTVLMPEKAGLRL